MLSSVARFVLDPFHILLFLIAGMLLTHWFGRKRTFRYSVSLVVIWFFVITTPFIPYIITHSLEKRHLPFDPDQFQSNNEVHIIVLGAGYEYNENLPPNSQLDKEMMSRLAEGVRIYHKLKNRKLIVSGPYNNDRYSQADIAKMAASQMGVPDSMIFTQSEGKTTYGEAQVYFQKFYEDQPLVVVTSASHMPRALGEFWRLGISAWPSPSSYHYRSENGFKLSFMPSLSHVDEMRAGMFEYAAMFRNYMREIVN